MKIQSLFRKCIRIGLLSWLIVVVSVVPVTLKACSEDENGAREINPSAETVDDNLEKL